MRISNQIPFFQPMARTQRSGSGKRTFGQQLDIATSRRMDRCEFPKNRVCPDSEWELSPYVNLMAAYDEWKAQQPPQALPDSQGRTAENIAYLKERYSGRLSWVERVDMLNTMMDMGVITREQRNSAYGDDTVILTPDMTLAEMDAAREAHRKKDPWNQDWNVYFSEDPVNGFKTADDVFAWLNTLRPVERSTDRRETSSANGGGLVTGVSPYVELMRHYRDWKVQQPPQQLPASYGPTEANLSYLRERYSGDLSWEERIEALDTMVDMGVITREQRNDVLGGGLTIYSDFAAEKTFTSRTIEAQTSLSPLLSDNWDVSLADFAASKFKTADDLFAWMDTLLERDG